jgi:hypothetical protein
MERAIEGAGAMGRQTPKEEMEVTERKMTMETEEGCINLLREYRTSGMY